jgi:two-component system, chemotaxis family, protein-glutamate methylesterase/glutaminase
VTVDLGHTRRDIIVVGASAGGVETLINLLAGLPRDLPAAMGIVLHRSPFFESRLAQVLGRRSELPVIEPEDGQVFEASCVYVAPRDLHMVLDRGRIVLDRGPKEHRTRPAIDPLFRTAAGLYGPRVVGVLLSGRGADGVSGLTAIKAAGGMSIAQDPQEAAHPTMPNTAIVKDDVDAVLPVAEIAAALVKLAYEPSPDAEVPGHSETGR